MNGRHLFATCQDLAQLYQLSQYRTANAHVGLVIS